MRRGARISWPISTEKTNFARLPTRSRARNTRPVSRGAPSRAPRRRWPAMTMIPRFRRGSNPTSAPESGRHSFFNDRELEEPFGDRGLQAARHHRGVKPRQVEQRDDAAKVHDGTQSQDFIGVDPAPVDALALAQRHALAAAV